MGISIVTIGVLLLSGCQDRQVNILIVNQDGQFFTADELTSLSDVTGILIPQTETLGATEADVAPVLYGIMNTWASQSRCIIVWCDGYVRSVPLHIQFF